MAEAKSVPLIDHRGTVVEPGKRVAFNFSGELAVGIVLFARPGQRADPSRGHLRSVRAEIQVEIEAPARVKGHISFVRDAKNVLVLFEKD